MRIIKIESCVGCPYSSTERQNFERAMCTLMQELDGTLKTADCIIPDETWDNNQIFEKCPLDSTETLIRLLQNKDDNT